MNLKPSRCISVASIALSSLLVGQLAAQPSPARAPAPAAGAPAATRAVPAQAELPPQTVLMPGLYLFQTRTRDGTCNDAPRTGYITSGIATLDGVPGSRTLTMKVVNSQYWPSWNLVVNADGSVIGTANMFGAKDGQQGSSRFELRTKKERLQGVGTRDYAAEGKPERCQLNYDALLKPLD